MTKTGERAAQRERAATVLDLYADGHSILSIARELKITPQQAQKRLADAIAALPVQQVEELRAGAQIRLDRVAAGLARLADRATDDRVLLQALNGLAQVEEKRVRLLGLALKPPKEDE